MTQYTVLIGGKAGDGILQAGKVIGSLFAGLGYHVYLSVDYPSLIRGGHNFCIIRIATKPVGAFNTTIDILLALDQQTITLHEKKLNPGGIIIYNSDTVTTDGEGIAIEPLLRRHNGRPIMGNTAMIGALCGVAGLPWSRISPVLASQFQKETELNLAIAQDSCLSVTPRLSVPADTTMRYPFFSGNEWIGLGLLAGGLDAYIAYPMTPSSGILHFFAQIAEETGILVYHPESEIAVILMAEGCAYAGKRAAVGTSGGGFCLMTEALSCAGQAEIPLVIVLAQRAGPSTGMPTYNAQTDLLFACYAGHGEFPRYLVAPATASEAYRFSAQALHIAWKYQIPSIILSDKTFSEGYYTADSIPDIISDIIPDSPQIPYSRPYERYAAGEWGISPLIHPPCTGEVVKVNSYTHDTKGISSEEPRDAIAGAAKRQMKSDALAKETDTREAVCTSGSPDSETALICWGSTRGVVNEVADALGLRIISPVVLFPFPKKTYLKAIHGVTRFILIEESATGQLQTLLLKEGFTITETILSSDGRPFPVESLLERVREIIHGQ
ncbi:MAG: 2-oxoacid:acceptor oxidoreductase subunit alpha [Methanospirillaceae archaeon]|nr:2-oxoacid:acceptor oxidoreductase subunit alpha [Methanospirillaceae archaeon]